MQDKSKNLRNTIDKFGTIPYRVKCGWRDLNSQGAVTPVVLKTTMYASFITPTFKKCARLDSNQHLALRWRLLYSIKLRALFNDKPLSANRGLFIFYLSFTYVPCPVFLIKEFFAKRTRAAAIVPYWNSIEFASANFIKSLTRNFEPIDWFSIKSLTKPVVEFSFFVVDFFDSIFSSLGRNNLRVSILKESIAAICKAVNKTK